MKRAPFTEPILHVDMDSFFVEVERRDDPSLRDRPVAVGGTGDRGVVASASYEARANGVTSAMPMRYARRLCRDLVVVSAHHAKYRQASEDVFSIFRSFTPLVEGASIDEAFLDISGLRLHYEDPEQVGVEIRSRLRAETGLPGSVGVARNKFLAKLASETAKPDGLLKVAAGAEVEFLHPLPVTRLWGVGAATSAALERLGIATVGALASAPVETLRRHLGSTMGTMLYDLAWGKDERPVDPDGAAKSISVEQTYEQDLADRSLIEAELLRHCVKLSGRMRRVGKLGKVLAVKVRFADFETVHRRLTLADSTNTGRDMFRAGVALLADIDLDRRAVRLVGVGMTDLSDSTAPRQLTTHHEWENVADAVDQVHRRFGDQAVLPARLAATSESISERGVS